MLSRLWKAAGYSLILLGLLALSTYLLYWLPVQVRARIREPLTALRLHVEVEDFEGARHTVRFYEPSSTEPFLTVGGLERSGRTQSLDELPRWVSSLCERGVEPPGPEASWQRFRGSIARLDLRRGSKWNFLSSLESPAREADEISPVFFAADSVTARLELDGAARGAWSLAGTELHCLALPASGTLILRAELESGAGRDSDGGELELWLAARSIVQRARISVRGLKRMEDWLPFLPNSFSRLESAFRPRGPVDLELDWSAGAESAAETLRATLSQYDSAIRLPGTELTLERVVGRILVENDSVTFGEDAGDGASPLDGMLAGERVYFHGRATGEGRTAVSVVLPALSLRGLDRLVGQALAEAPGPHRALADLLVRSDPRGTVSLRFTSGRREKRDGWSLAANFPRVELDRLPFARHWMGRLDLEGDSEGGRLSARLEGLDLAGAGDLAGSFELSYDADAYRLRIAPPRGDDPEAAPESGIRIGRYDPVAERWERGTAGTIEGSLTWPRQAGPAWGKLVVRTLPLEIGSGTLDLRIEEAAVTAATTADGRDAKNDTDDESKGEGRGSWSLEIAGRLGPSTVALDESWRIADKTPGSERTLFERGDTKWELSPSGVRVVSLKLEGKPGVFEFEGEVDFDGTLLGRARLTGPEQPGSESEKEEQKKTARGEPPWRQVTGSISKPRFGPVPPPESVPGDGDPEVRAAASDEGESGP